MSELKPVAEAILAKRTSAPPTESVLAAVSGIDASGKGYLTARLVAELQQSGVHAVGINIDGWLNLPSRRFNAARPAEHFYHHAIRFEDMFEQLVVPLKRHRSVRVEADFAEETARTYRRHTFDFQGVDVIVLEGIYLLKRAFLHYYDWTMWVECSFETALERALQRGQEGLPPEETVRAYRTTYFPAQEIHFRVDEPAAAADVVWLNDPRLGEGGPQVRPGGRHQASRSRPRGLS
jgi:uridine kinase